MSITPFWNTTDNYSLYKEVKKQADGYCKNCLKPINMRLYCSTCFRHILTNGLEGYRIKLGSVGKDTTNYQQHLHRLFFKCNAPVKYRGLKENRIKHKIEPSKVQIAEDKFRSLMLKTDYVYNNRGYSKENIHMTLFRETNGCVANYNRRLLYYICLYYISYYLNNNKSFKTLAHFQASMLQNLHINIENTYLRTTGSLPDGVKTSRHNYTTKYYYYLYEQITSIVSPIISSIH